MLQARHQPCIFRSQVTAIKQPRLPRRLFRLGTHSGQTSSAIRVPTFCATSGLLSASGKKLASSFRNRWPAVHVAQHTMSQLISHAVASTETTDHVDEAVLAEQQPALGQSGNNFSWTKQWYPVAITQGMAKDRPHAVKLLGGDFVLWCDAQDIWHCHKDLCPHRLAPLSEGKIVKDSLQCSYHGWRFAGDGSCVHIPQAPAEQMPGMCKSARSCATTFPTTVRYGLVWVWPDAGPARYVESAAVEVAQEVPPGEEVKPRIRLESDGTRWLEFLPMFRREFPYTVQTLFDNALDPAHVPWSHHGVIGNRDNVTPMEMKVLHDVSEKGTAVQYRTRAGASSATGGDLKEEKLYDNVDLWFKAPHTLLYDIRRGDGTRSKLLSYIVPTAQGSCMTFAISLDTQLSAQKLMVTPAWAAHLVFMKAGDGDLVLLKSQEELLAKPGRTWRDFWMPTESDRCVMLWRRWLDTFTGPDQGPYMLAKDSTATRTRVLTREEMLNRFSTHTANCTACLGAMEGFARASQAASYAAVALCALGLLAGLGIWSVGSHMVPLPESWVSAWPLLPQLADATVFGVGAALCGKLSAVFDSIRQEFVYKDYVHAYI